MTEREIEASLERSVRSLRTPEGGAVSVDGFALTWETLDLIIAATRYTEEEIVRLARLTKEEMGYDMSDAVASVVGYIHRVVR